MIRTVPLNRCKLHESKKAKNYQHTFMRQLYISIGSNGVRFPILVRSNQYGGYDVVDGSARVIICRELGIEEIDARILPISD
jgi:hypothetical protein